MSLDTVRVMPVGATGQTARGGRAVAVSRGAVSGGRSAVRAVVHSIGSTLVFALCGAGLSDGTAIGSIGVGR